MFRKKAINAVGTSPPASVTITVRRPLAASISSGQNASGTVGNATFTANTVAVTGGNGSYTYLWAGAGDGIGTWTTGGTGPSFTPSVANVPTCDFTSANYAVKVTDIVSSKITTFNLATYSYTRGAGTGGCN